jgi:hypothetical protein
MSRYSTVLNDIFSVFATPQWVSQDVKTFPDNFVSVDAGNEFIRVSVIPQSRGLNRNSIAGVLQIDIFTPAGNGPKGVMALADKLDQFLKNKSFMTASNNTQMLDSTLSLRGKDSANPALFRSVYTIPFNSYGVT